MPEGTRTYELARAVGRPVRVQWSREDEHGWDPKGPPQLLAIEGGTTEDGKIAAEGMRLARERFAGTGVQLQFRHGHANVGYGVAHNLMLNGTGGDYQLVMNPDVELAPEALDVEQRLLQQHQLRLDFDVEATRRLEQARHCRCPFLRTFRLAPDSSCPCSQWVFLLSPWRRFATER